MFITITGTRIRAAKAKKPAAERSMDERASSLRGRSSMVPKDPATAQARDKSVQDRRTTRIREEDSPAPRKDQPFLVNSWLMLKVTREVVSPLELVRSVTLSLTETSNPFSRYSSATAFTSSSTERYFSSPTTVLEDFFV